MLRPEGPLVRIVRAITSTGAVEQIPRGDQRLDDSTVERLALALHERWHGEYPPLNHSKTECARLSGAFDDIYAIEPEILALMRGA